MRVLIVDDSKFSQITTAKMLKQVLPQLEVDFAADGEEGWKKYLEQKPDYVFIDLLMPQVDGHALIRRIKQADEKANIIVVSADVQKSVREELEETGIKAFFNKPFNLEKAHEAVQIMKGDV
ncbi:MAG TPA: response regulator [Clostridia bacterium]|nr:response regulator [Clostridia bacterium]